MNETDRRRSFSPLREKLYTVIFEHDTPAGKQFDVWLLVFILSSVIVVILESISSARRQYASVFFYIEWFFTILFTIEYALRLYSAPRPAQYAKSFYGVIDLLAILPTYLSLLIGGTQYLLIIRALRLMRVFRIFKLGHFLNEGVVLIRALQASRAKITVFMLFVLLMVTVIGAVMYLVEGGSNEGFSSIPKSIYWAIVTLTTVGYGDITPVTNLGQFLSALVMILGYAVIAVPTGIVSAELVYSHRSSPTLEKRCASCGQDGHAQDAVFCKFCGEKLGATTENLMG